MRLSSSFLFLVFAVFFSACTSPRTTPPDDTGVGDSVVDSPADTLVDSGVPDTGNPDGSGSNIRICPGDSLAREGGNPCRVTSGSTSVLYTGDVLLPNEVLRGGQVLVDSAGTITCAACDCSTMSDASTATKIECADVAISPGLVNAHEHLTYAGPPYTATAERFEHRHDWRTGARGHTDLRTPSGSNNAAIIAWGELRHVVVGVTSIVGEGAAAGFARNLEQGRPNEGLGSFSIGADTFPLGDSNGTLRSMGCSYPEIVRSSEIASRVSYIAHVAEGIDDEARNEFACIRSGMNDLIEMKTSLVHGVGLLPADIGEMGVSGASVVWTPRSNITLYGDTARVTEHARLGVRIALGTDWPTTGSTNLARELVCADEFNRTYLDGYFTDADLFRMVTSTPAEILGLRDQIGTIAVGHVADLAFYDAATARDYRALIEARPENVVLVLRAGRPLFGDAAVVAAIGDGGSCETTMFCTAAKRICTMRETGMTLAALQAANGAMSPLTYCGSPTPANEPTCIPERAGTSPSPVVDGSGRYSGTPTATDMDGDGVDDASDSCPSVFNPVRPLDHGMQADADADGEGDACDVCPLTADSTTCAAVDPNDRDGDGTPNATDNCPEMRNADQADRDSDMKGDVCDACPDASNPGSAGCPATIYDVKTRRVAVGSVVRVAGAVVTAVGGNGFWMQVSPTDTAFTAVENSAVFVFTGAAPTVTRNQTATVDGTVTDFFGMTQLAMATVTSTGSAPAIEPTAVTSAEIATGARAAELEGALVRITNATVTELNPAPGAGDRAPTNEIVVGDSLRIDDFLHLTAPLPTVGATMPFVVGVTSYRNGFYKLLPRDAVDVGGAPPPVLAFDVSTVSLTVGARRTIRATLGSPAPAGGTMIALRAAMSDPAITFEPSATLTIAEGMTSATFDVVAGTTTGMNQIIGAIGGTDQATANVTVTAVTSGRLQIVEIYYDHPMADTTFEWVKLRNTTGAPIDLAGYSLSWAGTAWGGSKLQLSGTIADGECFVVGGTMSVAANGMPTFNQSVDFNPDIQNGGGPADGVALFAMPAAMVGASSVPIDAVIYGDAANGSGLRDESGSAGAVDIASAMSGQSIRLVGSAWVAGSPSPGVCP